MGRAKKLVVEGHAISCKRDDYIQCDSCGRSTPTRAFWAECECEEWSGGPYGSPPTAHRDHQAHLRQVIAQQEESYEDFELLLPEELEFDEGFAPVRPPRISAGSSSRYL